MQAVRGKDTAPEMRVRRLLHSHGYRYRIHKKDIPGKPDLAFPARKKAIFVHGCFWHGHNCPKGTRPRTNRKFWENKLSKNIKRDEKNYETLISLGWQPLVIWECELKAYDDADLMAKLKDFLEGSNS